MTKELQVDYAHSRVVYFLIRSSTNLIWNTANSALEVYATGTYTSYAISATEEGTASSHYYANFPTTISPGVYGVVAKQQLGGSVAETDPDIGSENFQWNGSTSLPLSDLATSGQVAAYLPSKIFRGQMLPVFPFKLVSSQDHVQPFVSGMVSGQISRDGAAFGALQSGHVSEIGHGWYSVALTSGDLLANTAALIFTANGISGGTSDQRDFGLVLQRTSGF